MLKKSLVILKSICGVISGVGQVGYDVILNRKKRSNVKELIKEGRKQQD
jgi:hypothetical protein